MEIKALRYDFSVCRLDDLSGVDFAGEFCFIEKTDEEVSLVCQTEHVPQNSMEREDGWKAFRIQGKLDFSLVGILAKISAVLAEKQIGIFAVSTYNTDYIFVKADQFARALSALEDSGYQISR